MSKKDAEPTEVVDAEKQVADENQPIDQQPSERRMGVQTYALIGVGVFVLLVVGLVFTQGDETLSTVEFEADRYDFAQNEEAIAAESSGFSYAFGTQPSSDGTDLEDFVPATEAQVQTFIDTVGSDEEQFDGDEDISILELIEFDQWNESGEVRAEVIEDYLDGEN